MARTLAGMTPVERKECLGRWADIGGELMVIRGMGAGIASWVDPRHFSRRGHAPFQVVTPRFDLPRAWNPDGTPAATTEEVEYRIVDPDTNGGRYEMRRWVRGVTEWRLDDE